MRLFVLAAGTGSRLLPLTKDRPKILIDLGGKTLLDQQMINAIESQVIDEVVFITGYKTEMIEERLEQYKNRIKISVVFNPFFDVSNNLLSLWTVNHLMSEGDFMITNGDNLYNINVFDQMPEDHADCIKVAIDYKNEYDEDDMKVSMMNSTITRIHKQIDLADTAAESVGLCLVKGEQSNKLFVDTLIELARNMDYRNRYWLEIFNQVIHKAGEVKYKVIPQDCWNEVDFHPDINIVKQAILSKLS